MFRNHWRGKGLAVQRGMMEARGQYLFFCDADLSMPVEEISKFIPPQLDHPDIAIASREARGSVRYHEPYYRHLTGPVFNTLIRLLVLPGLQDTQCGFKCIRAEVAQDIFPYQTLTGSAFDVELLYIHGGRPANYCEIGGNPSVLKVKELTRLILSKPGVDKIAVIMNVVCNTRVDLVARGIVKGILESGKNPAQTVAVFRVPGAWEDEGSKILSKYGIPILGRTVSIDEAAKIAAQKAHGSQTIERG